MYLHGIHCRAKSIANNFHFSRHITIASETLAIISIRSIRNGIFAEPLVRYIVITIGDASEEFHFSVHTN